MYEINIDLVNGIALLIHPADQEPESVLFRRVDPNEKGHVAFYDEKDSILCMVPLTSVKRLMFVTLNS